MLACAHSFFRVTVTLLCLQRTLLSRLHQANIFAEQNVPDAAPLLPHKLAQQAMQAHVAQAADPNTSQLQRDVGAILGKLLNVPWSRVRHSVATSYGMQVVDRTLRLHS
jgi:hypothetical protein